MADALNDTKKIVRPLELTRGEDFQLIVRPQSGLFQTGTTARIDFFTDPDAGSVTASWSASVSTAQAVWKVESEVADLVKVGTAYLLYFSFPGSPRIDFCRAYGNVVRAQPRSKIS
ncbi:LtfC-like domain-containing protein [Rhodococcoides fascians]|uniref:LtfC-like domain-containing protein n=1 Tax=Rhodococcoides fascians TaxID=1828 RepID=UPI00056B26B0|nr:hypothetical protein [Rhodococcus fascians]